MSERFYPVILATISERPIRMKIINDKVEYDAFYARYKQVGTIILELKTLEAFCKENMPGLYAATQPWSLGDLPEND
ncbi:MAG TPA: hypothetical protein VIL90_06680 [Puia sp.]|jgi:hypothetical protein